MPRRERPLDSSDDPLVLFAADLRKLREKAGAPGYRELGRRAHYSAATLSDAASGRKLPTLAVTLAYVRACEGDAGEWETRWRELAADLAPSLPPVDIGDAPYLGLAAFQQEHADRFFGRDRLVGELTSRLERHPFLAVFGASGAGKSSLLRAGLLPALDGTKILFTPGAHPLRECAVHVAALTGLSAVQVLADLESDPANLNLLLRQANVDIVVVDQFEEVFTLCADTAERDAFIAALLNSDNKVVIGVRTDFYTHCSTHAALVDALRDAQVTVGPMTVDELRQAITRPATRSGLNVDSALLAHLVAEANGRAGVLPLLSHALLETWRRRRGTTLALTGFQAAGGIDGALARTADAIYETFPPEEQDSVRRLFLRLTAPGEGTEDTKRRIDRAELDEEVPAALVSARLLTVDGDSVEITHESLIRSWPRLRDWLAEDRQALRAHRQLTDATTEWETHDHDPGALYRGAKLAVARELDRDALSRREQAFLDASLDAETELLRVAKRQTRRTRAFAAALAVLLLVASSIAVYATREQRVSESRTLAAQALQMHDTSVVEALQDSLAAYTEHPTTEARSALIYNTGRPANHGGIHVESTSAMALSPDGKLVATPSGDNTALWEVAPRRYRGAITLPRPESSGSWSSTQALAFSSDSTRLAIGTTAGLHVHDIASGRTTVLPLPDGAHFRKVAFAPGDQRVYAMIITGVPDTSRHSVVRWDLAAGGGASEISAAEDFAADANGAVFLLSEERGLSTFAPDTGSIRTSAEKRAAEVLAVSRDGATAATGGTRGTVDLWDGRALAPAGELVVGAPVTGLAFADRGRLLVVCTQGEIQFWDVGTRTKVHQQQMTRYIGPRGLSVSLDDTIAVPGYDVVALWRLAELPHILRTRPLTALGFTPDGLVAAATGPENGPVTVNWPKGNAVPLDTTFTGKQNDHLDVVTPDGTRMAVTSGYTTEIRDTRTHAVVTTLVPDERYRETLERGRPLTAGPFSDDGGLLATRTPGDGFVWDVRTGKEIAAYPAGSTIVTFSPDSSRFALFDLQTTEIRLQEVGADQPGPAWHTGVTDGQFVAYGSNGELFIAQVNGMLNVINPEKRTKHGVVGAHEGRFTAMAASPDRGLLATVGIDRKLNIWDTRTRELWASLPTTSGIEPRIAWSKDGTELAMADEDGVTVWPISPELAIRKACDWLRRDIVNDGPVPAVCH